MPIEFGDGILLLDEDVTPVADRILKVVNGRILATDDLGVETKLISAASIEFTALDADTVDGQQASEFIDHADIAQAEGMLRKTGTATYEAIKSNLAAVVAPAATDDSAAGYAIGSLWIDTVADKVYQCVDATAAAAIWKDLSVQAVTDTNSVAVQLFDGKHSTSKTTYKTISKIVIDFGRLPTASPAVSWMQNTMSATSASVRLQNITDATTIFEMTGITTTGVKTAVSTLPTGIKLCYFQHLVVGSGNSKIEGGTLHVG